MTGYRGSKALGDTVHSELPKSSPHNLPSLPMLLKGYKSPCNLMCTSKEVVLDAGKAPQLSRAMQRMKRKILPRHLELRSKLNQKNRSTADYCRVITVGS